MTQQAPENGYIRLLEKMLKGDKLSLARLITLVENDSPIVPEIMEHVFPRTGRCFTLGVTGPPGAGKSTLVDKLIVDYTNAGVDIHYMTEAEFNTWMEFAKKTAWKNFAETVDGGQELLDMASAAMK